MRRIFVLFLSVLLSAIVLLFPAIGISAEEPRMMISSAYENHAEAIYFYSYDAKSVLYSKGTDKILKPASTVKIMTGLLACEKLESRLNEEITITREMLVGHTGTTMGLTAGMNVSIEDLLYGAICGCNNDAAQVLAFVCSGSIENFVSEMNSYAARIGMSSTVYTNPTGLDDAFAQTSISDVALLSHRAVKNELYLSISSAKNHTVSLNGQQTVLYNRNALISHFTSDKYLNDTVSGLNAGSTDEGGYVASVLAESDGSKYLCIVMGADFDGEEIYSYKIVNELIAKADKSFGQIMLFSQGEQFSEVDVNFALSTESDVKLSCVLEDDLYAYLPSDIDKNKDLKYRIFLHNETLDAPVSKGDIVGGVNVYYKGEPIASGVLVAGETFEANSFLVTMNSMKEFLLSRYFLIFFAFFAIGILIFLYLDRNFRRRKKVGYIHYKKF